MENDVVHLTDSTFDTFIAENSKVMVFFYAPCKLMHSCNLVLCGVVKFLFALNFYCSHEKYFNVAFNFSIHDNINWPKN